jgi:type II secretion system protein N
MKFFRRRRGESPGKIPTKRLPRRWGRTTLGGLGVALGAFLVGCYLFFPTAVFRDRLVYEVNRRTQAQLTIEHLSLRFPPGFKARNLTLRAPVLPQEWSIDEGRIAPLWLSLFSTNPGIDLTAHLWGGDLETEIFRDGTFSGTARNLTLKAPLGASLPLTLSATLRQGAASGATPLRPTTASQGHLVLEGVELAGLKAVGGVKDSLPLGTVTLTATGQGNSFKVEGLTVRGGDLEIEGNGSLLLAMPAPQSRLNLTLTLKPGASLDPALLDLLQMFAKPAGDGSLRLRLTGSLTAPNLQ